VLAALAARQHGVVARWQLLRAGLTPEMIKRRLASGHLHPVHRGVYAVGHPRLSLDGRRHAAVLAGGEGAMLSHRSAGAVWNLRPDNRARFDVTTPRRARSRAGLVVHEGKLDPRDVTTRRGIPITSIPRTLLDLATTLTDDDLLAALENADKLDLLDARAVDDVCARNRGHQGIGAIDAARDAYDPRHRLTNSQFERRAIALFDRLGLPRPEINAQIGEDTVDLLWREHGLIVELDSWEHHRHRGAFERDRERDRKHLVLGLSTARLTWRQLETGAADLAQLLSAASERRSSREDASPISSARRR
jgi:very-short-patch-repair endonuclease